MLVLVSWLIQIGVVSFFVGFILTLLVIVYEVNNIALVFVLIVLLIFGLVSLLLFLVMFSERIFIKQRKTLYHERV